MKLHFHQATLTLSPEYMGEGTRKLLNPLPFVPDTYLPAYCLV